MMLHLYVSAYIIHARMSTAYFLHVAMKEWTETKPVLSPPAALNMGAFQ